MGSKRMRRWPFVPLLVVGVFSSVCLLLSQSDEATNKRPAAFHPPGSFAVLGGHRIWYEAEGRGEAVVLIPGGPGSSHDYFHPFFSNLSKQYRIIYYDPFGTGKSERAKNPAEYSLGQEIEEVGELRKYLGIERWSVFGHSWGGVVAQGYAIKYARSVQRLVLSDSPVRCDRQARTVRPAVTLARGFCSAQNPGFS